MMRRNHRLGLCFHGSGNPVDCENIVIRWFTRKHLYRHQKHVSESTRAEDMLKSVYLATLVVESGNPVCPTLARMSPFDCPPQKTYV